MQIINPAVALHAERFTDGPVTDRILADVAAMERLPLYVDAPARMTADEAARERVADRLYFAGVAVTTARRAYDAQRRQIGFANRAPADRRRATKAATFGFLNKARAALRLALRRLGAAHAAANPTPFA